MAHLHAVLADRVREWQVSGFDCEEFPAIAEILEFQTIDADDDALPPQSRFLRAAQIEALSTYWYLRLVEGTLHVRELYNSLFPSKSELINALGLDRNDQVKAFLLDHDVDDFWDTVRDDDVFVAANKLEALRESLTLDYPSYILALTMGAGKTALIGAIIATEFCMALEYPDGPFVKNALVFAPGLTILGSLRQLASLPFELFLPERFYRFYAATVKLVFTRDGDPDIQVIRGDEFNIVVTNTEKIRITKESVRKSDLPHLFSNVQEEDARTEVANRRLQAIASLPHLAVFSDEAHHTYGRRMEKDLKRVRRTIDYLHERTNLIAVVNTTGTPYLKKQPLMDVVYWYGLSQGIDDGILKHVSGNIHAYSFDAESTDDFITAVLADFFRNYGDVRLPTGHAAKLAIYFPQVDDLQELRPVIETALVGLGQSPDIVLENTNKASAIELDAFERLNHPESPHRVILLVNKGTEGWDCPSLFACALARKLKTSNNFVLQASCRCLRQVPGNPHPASIYLSRENERTLDKELNETYGETLRDLQRKLSASRRTTIRLRKLNLPPLVIRQLVRRVEKAEPPQAAFHFSRPEVAATGTMERRSFDLSQTDRHRGVLLASDTPELIETAAETIDLYSAATKLAAVYRFDEWLLKDELARLYPDGQIPETHLAPLAEQLEQYTSHYTITEEEVEVALALVKPDGFQLQFESDGTEVYTAEISYPVSRESLLIPIDRWTDRNTADLGFHYTPYNFDSQPEADYFEQLLQQLNLDPAEVDDIYFTGAFTSGNKTDFLIEYRDIAGKWRTYTPDFVIRRKDGRCLIVEIKMETLEPEIEAGLRLDEQGQPAATKEGRKAVALKRWTQLNAEKLKYEFIFASTSLPMGATDEALTFARED